MRRYTILAATIVIGCTTPFGTVDLRRTDPDQLELAVYATLIRSYVKEAAPKPLVLVDTNVVVILRAMSSYMEKESGTGLQFESWPADSMRKILTGSTRASFNRRNVDTGRIAYPEWVAPNIRRVSLAEINAQPRRPFTCSAGGRDDECVWIAFSHVGVSDNARQALVYVQYECGRLCGDGDYVILQRDRDDEWHVSRTITIGVS